MLVARAVKGAEHIPVIPETEVITLSLLLRSVKSKGSSFCKFQVRIVITKHGLCLCMQDKVNL